MLISVVFSFRNEESNLRELVKRVDAAFSLVTETYEMIFVNDDSTDHSLSILLELQESYPIHVINMSRRFGVTPCVLAGMAQSKGSAVIYMDTDLQDPPELIPELIKCFKDGAEVVHTTRTHRDGESAFKMWLTKKAYRAINYFSDIELPENTGDFKLLSRKAVNHILSLKEHDPYMRGLSIWLGYKQEFVYYRRESRFSGETHMPLLSKGPVREFVRGLTAFSAGPLYLSFYMGLITSVVCFMLIIYAVVLKVMGVATPGVSGLLVAISFFSGVILLSIGLLGIYIARIYNEVKGRPQYLIKEIIEKKTNDAS